ncbi:MAG: aspartate aminotransferase family protein [Clostridiales bacterium]|nr:aspartate aminotransferase family protein [Clostridiales bacterium]
MNTIDIDNTYVAHSYGRFPICITGGKGSILYDENGKEYIDFGAGIAVNSFGISDDVWKEAVIEQLNKVQHTSNLYYTEPCAKLAQMLCERTGMQKVFFSNSGAEANECAIKAARRYAFLKYGDGHSTIITLKNSFHGRTITTLAATGQDHFHHEFTPFTEGFVYAEANNIDDVIRLATENKCIAVMIEIVQGEGGVCPLDKEFVQAVRKFTEENDMLLIVDEVQTGNGRSGKLYAYMNYDVTPDIVSTAKGLAGGLPLGATMLGDKVKDVYTPGTHGSTFGGNPVCSAAAISVLKRIDDDLLADVCKKSEYVFSELTGADGVEEVTGMGLMIGIKCTKPAGDVVKACMEKGLLLLTAKDKVRLLPALNIDFETLKNGVAILKETIAE